MNPEDWSKEASMAICTNCRSDILDSYEYCPKCGSQINKNTAIYCSRCGAQNLNDSGFCQKCGSMLSDRQAAPQPVKPQTSYNTPVTGQSRRSGLAVASLVLGIIGFFGNPCFILAIIFGAIAMGQTKPGSNLRGRGMAITGFILGLVVLAFWIIIGLLLFIGYSYSDKV
jgi:uncharacterized membrane protein YvbJ